MLICLFKSKLIMTRNIDEKESTTKLIVIL